MTELVVILAILSVGSVLQLLAEKLVSQFVSPMTALRWTAIIYGGITTDLIWRYRAGQ